MEISAFIVTYNEEKRLRDCLKSLSFCDQIVVVDLGSTDRSVEIARSCNVQLAKHAPVPFVEEVWADVIPMLNHNWVLRADPDEVFPPDMVSDLNDLLECVPDDVGYITIPHQFYFLENPLRYTVWGGIRNIGKVFHKHRVNIYPRIHGGIEIKDGYKSFDLTPSQTTAIQHFWVDSYSQLFSKHQRYIKHEGKSRYENGQRFSWIKMVTFTAKALLKSLVKKKGWLGGWVGWYLSFFYAIYEARAWLSLRTYQYSLRKSVS